MPTSELYRKIQAEAREQRQTSRDLERAERAERERAAAAQRRVRDGLVNTLAASAPTLTLAELARAICDDWPSVNANVYNPARPYVRALEALDVVSPRGTAYGADSAVSIVLYFLSNAKSWTGPVARIVKAELRRRLKP